MGSINVKMAVFLFFVMTAAKAIEGGRDWAAADSIELQSFGSAGGWLDNARTPPAVPSPDGKLFYVLSTRSSIGCDCNFQKLEIYESRKVLAWLRTNSRESIPLPPVARVEMRTHKSLGQSIDSISWADSGAALIFRGRDAEDHSQIYRLNVGTNELQPLTLGALEISSPRVEGDLLLYRQYVPLKLPDQPYPMAPAPRNERGDLVLPRVHPTQTQQLVASYKGGRPWVLPIDASVPINAWISPNGSQAILLRQDARARAVLPADLSSRGNGKTDFILVNFAQEEMRSIGAPIVRRQAGLPSSPPSAVFWSADGSHALVVNVSERAWSGATEDSSGGYLAAYDVETSKWQPLEPLVGPKGTLVTSVGWLKYGEEVLVSHQIAGQKAGATIYELEKGQWRGRAASGSASPSPRPVPGLPDGLSIAVRQNANTPPKLVASDGRREKVLVAADTTLNGIWRAAVEPFSWKMADGRVETGGLSLPRSRTKPFPLVVQAYHYVPDVFLPDGPYGTGYARQALVAQGFAVLEINILDLKEAYSPKEGPAFVERIDAAVTALGQAGLVDVQRVGLIGFSRGGFLGFYAATHPGKIRLAAVEVADSTTHSFPQYLATTMDGAPRQSEERMYGGDFWRNRSGWLEHDVLFNADRLESPLLLVTTSIDGMTQSEMHFSTVATLASLQLSGSPFDALLFPNGSHPLWRPQQRLASMEATVDWMKFWLQQREDANPSKASQYARWRKIVHSKDQRASAVVSTPGAAP